MISMQCIIKMSGEKGPFLLAKIRCCFSQMEIVASKEFYQAVRNTSDESNTFSTGL